MTSRRSWAIRRVSRSRSRSSSVFLSFGLNCRLSSANGTHLSTSLSCLFFYFDSIGSLRNSSSSSIRFSSPHVRSVFFLSTVGTTRTRPRDTLRPFFVVRFFRKQTLRFVTTNRCLYHKHTSKYTHVHYRHSNRLLLCLIFNESVQDIRNRTFRYRLAFYSSVRFFFCIDPI